MYFGDYCYVVKPRVFAGGGMLSLACAALAIVYFATLSSKSSQAWRPQQNQGIAIGHPQVPACTRILATANNSPDDFAGCFEKLK